MNWKKILIGTVSGALAGSLPALFTVVSTLAALFTKSPQQS